MVETQIAARGVRDPRVLAAMRKVPRHLFVDPDARAQAYEDHPVPIGNNQTISQPYIVALMTELLELPPKGRVLEIGTGSGYQSAILAEIAAEVYSIEIVPELAEAAATQVEGARLRQRRGARGRRVPGVDRARALRRDHRDGGARPDSEAARRAARRRAAAW